MYSKIKQALKTLKIINDNEPYEVCFSTKFGWEKDKQDFFKGYRLFTLQAKNIMIIKERERISVDPYMWEAIFEIKLTIKGKWILFRNNK